MIDAYDVLGLDPDATEEDIKKAYRRLSLQYHPDKVQASGNKKEAQQAGERFNEITLAKDILSDAERRKVYDTFGLDLGEERPEMEIWSIGLSALVSPTGHFTLRTIVVRGAIWFIGFKWVGRILMLCGVGAAGLYASNITIREINVRSSDAMSFMIVVGIVDLVVLVYWIWPLLADVATLLYLATEIVGPAVFLESWKYGIIAAVSSLILAWLVKNWWLWIIGLEVLITVVMLIALTVSAGVLRLWIDNVQANKGDQLKEWRMKMRQSRKVMVDKIADLEKKQGEDGSRRT